MNRWLGVVVGVVLATAPLGEGGRHALALLCHHTVLLAAFLAVSWRRPTPRVAVAGVALFGALALVLSPYRYATLLVVADLVAAALLYSLCRAVAPELRERSLGIGLTLGAALVVLEGFVQWMHGQPVRGPFVNPNQAASLVAAAGIWLLGEALGRGLSPVARGCRLCGAALSLAYVVVSGSKGAALAAAAGALVVLVLAGRRRTVLLVFAAMAVAVVLPTRLGERIRGGSSLDLYEYQRIRIWRSGLAMALDHALVGGVGLGRYRVAALAYNFPVDGAVARYGKNANVAHCEYLELFAEASLPGLLLFAVPLGLTLLRLRRRWAEGPPARDLVARAAGALSVLLCHATVDANLHAPANLYALAALVAVAAPEAETRVHRRLGRTIGLLGAAAWWSGGVFLPWLADACFQRSVVGGDPGALRWALKLCPGHAGYWGTLAQAGEREADHRPNLAALEFTVHALTRAMDVDRLNPEFVARRAIVQHRVFLSRYPSPELGNAALEDYARAIGFDPDNALLEVNRAMLFAALSRRQEAERSLRRAFELEPNLHAAQVLRQQWAEARGDPEEGARARAALARIEGLRQALKDRGTPPERRLLGLGDDAPGPLRSD